MDNYSFTEIMIKCDELVNEPHTYFDNCYIGKSKIHGSGVFAKRDINKDEIITFYPVHFVAIGTNPDLNYKTLLDKRKNTSVLSLNLENFKDYSIQFNPFISIIGDPAIIHDNSLAHMINDGSNINGTEEEYNNSIDNNSFFNISDKSIFVRANKSIKKDEEILVSYGYKYWHSRK